MMTLRVKNIYETVLPSVEVVEPTFQESAKYNLPYIHFNAPNLAWEEQFLRIEENTRPPPRQRIFYAIYPNKAGTQWNVKSIRISSSSAYVDNRALFQLNGAERLPKNFQLLQVLMISFLYIMGLCWWHQG